MGLFSKKQVDEPTQDEVADDAERDFLDETFREELRNHGRWYFEKVIKENGTLFKKELDATVAQISVELEEHVIKQLDASITQINTELKEHVTQRLDEQFAEYGKAMQEAQQFTLESLTRSAHDLQEQHQKLAETLKKSISDQEEALNKVSSENVTRMDAMKDAQDKALVSLNESAKALQEQHDQMGETLKKNVADQQEILVNAFEGNMAHIVEHYLLDAVGDQYDMKSQLPSIIQQMDENKQAIVDDMKL